MTLSDRARIILFWFTIGLMIVVAVLAAITILRACGGPTSSEPPPTITPPEVSLCAGEQQQFTADSDGEISWEATGGTIDENGLFTAGDTPGNYAVVATRGDSGKTAQATVYVAACTPTPSPTPLPTVKPSPSPTPSATPTPEEDPEETAEATGAPTSADAQGDVGAYETGETVEGAPAGIDIRIASVDPDLSVSLQSTENVPEDLTGFANEGDALLWILLHEAIPDPPGAYANWLFVLDVDGNTETGRPVGSRRINPDLGDEVAIGVSYNPGSGAYEPYTLVWSEEQSDWTDGPDVRHKIGESRQVVGLALPLDELTEAVSNTSGTTLETGAVKGRAAAESYTGEGQRVIDFYPDLPE